MPELRAQMGGPEVVFAQYQFSEARRPQWEEFWRAHKGDLREIHKVAKDTMKVAHPNEFVAALHRFLFYTYPGNTWLQRQAQAKDSTPRNFLTYLRSIADTHDKEPMSRNWYRGIGVTPERYIRTLRMADVPKADASADEYLMRRVNAQIPDLGFKLYESYLLLKAPKAKATKQQVLDTLSRVAHEIEQAIVA